MTATNFAPISSAGGRSRDIHSEGNTVLPRLPKIDYERHPAYGAVFGKPTLALRAKALARLLPWMGFVALKEALRFDTLPRRATSTQPLYEQGLLARARLAPTYIGPIAKGLGRHWWRALSGQRMKPPASGPAAELFRTFRRDGILPMGLSPSELEEIRTTLEPEIASLKKRRAEAAKRSFESNQLFLNAEANSELYRKLDDLLARHHVFEVASAYLGRPVRVRDVLLQINDAADKAFNRDKFADVGVPDSACNYMHVDTQVNWLKVAFYLTDVGPKNGPFSYVKGTNRIRVGKLEGLVRRSVDRADLSGYSPQTRELFLALPKPLRMKATFGSDLQDETSEGRALVGSEYRFTSADGNMALFDNIGIHRGALVEEGERQVLFLSIA